MVICPPPRDGQCTVRHIEPVQRVVGDDEDTTGLVHGERVADALVQRLCPYDAARRVDKADNTTRGDEPQSAAPVRQRGNDRRLADSAGHVVLPDEPESVAGLGDDVDVPVVRRYDGAILVVEIEV